MSAVERPPAGAAGSGRTPLGSVLVVLPEARAQQQVVGLLTASARIDRLVVVATTTEAREAVRTGTPGDLAVVDGTAEGHRLTDELRDLGWRRTVVLGSAREPSAVVALLRSGVSACTFPGIGSAPPAAVPVPRLPVEHLDLLQSLADGASTARLAAQLGVSADTVKSRLRSVRRSLGATSRAHAVLIALRHGLIR